MRKKILSNTEKITRGKRILVIFLLMSVVCVIGNMMRKFEDKPEPLPVEKTMDAMVDSLLTLAGFPNATLIDKDVPKTLNYVPLCEEELELDFLEFNVAINSIPEEEKEDALKRIELLKTKVNNHYEKNGIQCYNRRIWFTAIDQSRYTCLQTIDLKLEHSEIRHIINIDNSRISKKEISDIINSKSL